MNKGKIVTLLGLTGFIVMADNWVVSPILPAISNNLGIDFARAGLLISAYMLPFGVFQLISSLSHRDDPELPRDTP